MTDPDPASMKRGKARTAAAQWVLNAPLLEEVINRKPEIENACWRLRVRRSELFGSAAGAEGMKQARDFDFLVGLGDAAPIEYADAYFSLRELLESLFDRPVDLGTEASISNCYFREGIDRTRRLPCAP